MPRLTRDQWDNVRAEREAGASFGDLAAKYGVDKAAIVRRARAESWGNGEDVANIVRRRVTEKITGVTGGDPQKKASAINAAADRGAEVIRRHQEETNAVRERLYAGLKAHKAAEDMKSKRMAFEDLKAAKISSEAMMNIHRLERKAFYLDDRQGDGGSPDIVIQWEGSE